MLRSTRPLATFLLVFSMIAGQSALSDELAAPNAVSVSVGGGTREPNVPFVSVTVCVPGTSKCQTIDHILLDTGSSGLRIFSSQLSLGLPSEPDSLGEAMAECMSFGGGSSWWGPVVMADVVLGGETASNVPIQLWNNQYASKPSSCAAAISDPSEWGSNGILGVSPGLTDCYGNSCPASGGPAYFACNAGTCSPVVPSPLQQIKNPVALLDTDNNGVTISFPSIPPGGVLSSSGTMFLGVGTRSNNVPPAGTPALKTTYEGWFNAQLNGKTFWSRMDTGTESWNIPDGTGVPLCTGPGTAGHYLCPSSPLTISLELQDISKAISEPITFQIANVEQEFGSGNFASSDMGQDWGAGISDAMILGMSFFYGKTVYFVIDGRSTSLGTGPLNAFSQNLKIQ